jgi:hypothetical protein
MEDEAEQLVDSGMVPLAQHLGAHHAEEGRQQSKFQD